MAPKVARRCCAGWYPGAVICLAAWYRKLRFRAVLIQVASRSSSVSLREKAGSWGVSDHANCWNLRCAFVVDGPRYARRTECYDTSNNGNPQAPKKPLELRITYSTTSQGIYCTILHYYQLGHVRSGVGIPSPSQGYIHSPPAPNNPSQPTITR